MNDVITYILYIISVLGLLIAYVKARNYIKTLEEYTELQDKEICLLEFKAKLQDCLLKAYHNGVEKTKYEKIKHIEQPLYSEYDKENLSHVLVFNQFVEYDINKICGYRGFPYIVVAAFSADTAQGVLSKLDDLKINITESLNRILRKEESAEKEQACDVK